MSSAFNESRTKALKAAQGLIEANGWNALTLSGVAEASGITRQWLHSLFGGHQGLVEALASSLFGPWRAGQLEIIAARLSLGETVERSFTLLMDSPGALAITLRHQMIERGPIYENLWTHVAQAWAPVWQAERRLSKHESSAVTTIFLSCALGLEVQVRAGELSATLAKRTLISAVQGTLQ